MNLYKILEVSSTATEAEIKAAYRRLALKHHPDRGGKAADFQNVNTAYQVLSNTQLRKEYDRRAPFERDRQPTSGYTPRQARKSSIFGPLYDDLMAKLSMEGLNMGNADDFIELAQAAAKEARENVGRAVEAANGSPSRYADIISEIFGDHVTFGKGR